MPHRSRPALLIRFAAVAALATLGLAAPQAASAAPATSRTPRPSVALPAALDPLQPYVPQDSCDAVAKPGATALLALLLKTYPGSTSMGIANSCAAEGMTSEHAEGRALDWGVSARTAAGRASANAMLTWLFADDAIGDQQVMARRLGVMYVIWNGQIREAGGGWTSYLPGTCWTTGAHPKAKGDDTTCHRNHVHISLGWSGAWKRTSFWTGHVAPIDYGPCVVKGKKYAPKYHGTNPTPCNGARRGGSDPRPAPTPSPMPVVTTPLPITLPVTGPLPLPVTPPLPAPVTLPLPVSPPMPAPVTLPPPVTPPGWGWGSNPHPTATPDPGGTTVPTSPVATWGA